MNKIDNLIQFLEYEWGEDGFLYELRKGIYTEKKAEDFFSNLGNFNISNEELIPKRLISLIWYLPIFLSWQRERILKNGGNIERYDLFSTKIINILESIFGIP